MTKPAAASALWPTAGEMLFSVKTFIGAMLALYIAFSIDLPRPYWAMATAYIVAQPLSGALRSKALYRVLGTMLGAVATVVLVPNLVNAPELLSLAMGLWTAACLYLALLDRTPRSYVFMLAGYSAAIIGFPAVNDPGSIFDTAVARVEEITLGIVCATVVGSVVFPRSVGAVISARIDGWLRDAGRWTLDALAGRRDDEETAAARRRLAADAVELYMLSTHLAYDTSLWQGTTRWVRLLRQRMVMLLPILSSIADRMAELRRNGAQLPPSVQALLGDLSAWIAAGPHGQREEGVRLRAAIARIEAETPAGPSSDWNAVMLASLLVRLRELVETVQDCRDLRRQINSGGREAGVTQERRLVARAGDGAALHRDHGMAILSGFSAALAVLLCCVAWIATGWPDGAVATEMAAVACCFFAAQDDPVPAIVSFTIFSTVALVIDTVYLFAILPMIDGFPMLVLVLAPVFLVIGIGMVKPASTNAAMALAANSATLMGLQSAYSADFAAFLNSGFALVFGMSVAAIVTGLVRSVGAEWSAWRLLRAGWADLAAVAAPRGGGASADRTVFAGRMLDRLGMLTPRLAMVAPGADVAAADALADLRIGLNIVDLQRGRPALPPEARRAVDALLDALSRFFDRHASAVAAPPPEQLLRLIDRALARVTATGLPGRRSRSMLLALVGIRRGLFPDAPPYKPASPAPVSPSPVDMREVA